MLAISLDQFKQMCRESFGKTDMLTRDQLATLASRPVNTLRKDEANAECPLQPMNSYKDSDKIVYKVEVCHRYCAWLGRFAMPVAPNSEVYLRQAV